MADEETLAVTASVPSLQLVDLVRAGSWKTAFFTSYSLSLSYFEAVILYALRHAGARAASIAVDLDGYRSSLSERGVSEAGRSYDVVPMSLPKGIFHPKLMVLEGDSGLRATIGSGNLTFRGWSSNLEVVEYLNARTEPQAFGDLADFLERLSSSVQVAGRLTCERDPVPPGLAIQCRIAARARRGDGALRVLHSIQQPIADQVCKFAGELGPVSSFTLVSPFLNVDAVQLLAMGLGCENVSVCVSANSPEQFDFAAARAAGLVPRAVTAEEFLDPKRPLHAKILEIQCRRGRITVAGSVNATMAAMMSTQNVELAVLRLMDRPFLIGWRPCQEPIVKKAPYAGGHAVPCLVARWDGTGIAGRIMGIDGPEGLWTATIGQEEIGLSVQVDANGRFQFHIDHVVDLLRLQRAVQLVLFRGTTSAAGWLVLEQILAAIRERGRSAVAIARVLAGAGDAEDFAAILAFLAENPAPFLYSSSIGSSGDKTKHVAAGASGTIDLNTLVPIDALSPHAAVHMGTGASLFERLVSNLHRLIAAAASAQPAAMGHLYGHPTPEDPDAPPPPSVANAKVEEVLDIFFEWADHNPAGKREVMQNILAFIRFGAGWAKEPEEFIEDSIRRWLTVARRMSAGANQTEPDDLDRMLVAVVISRVIAQRMGRTTAHEFLQTWCGGLLRHDWAANAAPSGLGGLEGWLAHDAGEQAWSNAWQGSLAAVTRWSSMHKLMDALFLRSEPGELPGFLTIEEAKTFHKAFLAKKGPQTQSVISIGTVRKMQGCPKHNLVLAKSENHRFLTERVAMTQCCGRVLVNLDLDREHHSAT